jgi:hypothetical protein
MELLRARLSGKWEVLHVDGHVEKRKTKKADWTFEERGNTASDVIAKRCMKGAMADRISDMQLPWKGVKPASGGAKLETGGEQAGVATANTAGGNGRASLSSAVANTVGHTRTGSGAGREVDKWDDTKYVHERVHDGTVCGPVCSAKSGRWTLSTLRHTPNTRCMDAKRTSQRTGDGSKVQVGVVCVQ